MRKKLARPSGLGEVHQLPFCPHAAQLMQTFQQQGGCFLEAHRATIPQMAWWSRRALI
jgi:hypothetical protein